MIFVGGLWKIGVKESIGRVSDLLLPKRANQVLQARCYSSIYCDLYAPDYSAFT